MRFLGVSGSSWVAVVIAAVVLSLMSDRAVFVQILPEKLIITALTVVLSTALFRLL